MKKLMVLFVLVCLGVLSAPAAVLGGPGGKEVQIVNPLPMPVTGGVNVTNEPTVNSRQEGAWDINIYGDDSAPVPVKSPYPRIPYSVTTGRRIPSERTGLIFDITPADLWEKYPEHHFVIEYISIIMWVESTDTAMCYVKVETGSSGAYFAPQEVLSPYSGRAFLISQKTFMVLPYDEHLVVELQKENNAVGSVVQIGFDFHGYLVPQASPSLSR